MSPITLSEADGVRYLHFGTPWVQGAMRIARPYAIELDYVRDMMAWLLFLHAPAHILQLGLGAGALTKWCWKHLPDSQVTVVENAPDVVAACRQYFRLPPDDGRLTVRVSDAAEAVTRRAWRSRFGVIQIDLYDEAARGPVLDALDFYRDCRALLTPTGILVVNLFGRGHRASERSIERLHRIFDDRVLMLPQTVAGNRVVLAFQGPPLRPTPAQLNARARWLDRRYALGAQRWAQAAWPVPMPSV
jgi:spermidine synthase